MKGTDKKCGVELSDVFIKGIYSTRISRDQYYQKVISREDNKDLKLPLKSPVCSH